MCEAEKESVQLVLKYIRNGEYTKLKEVSSTHLMEQISPEGGTLNKETKDILTNEATKNEGQLDTSFVYFRRVTNSRLQFYICLGRQVNLLFESTSIGHPNWILERVSLEEFDDDEYYWKRWYKTIDQAEKEYSGGDDSSRIDVIDLISLKQSVRAMQKNGTADYYSSSSSTAMSSSVVSDCDDSNLYTYQKQATEAIYNGVVIGESGWDIPIKAEPQCMDNEDLYWESYFDDDLCIY